MAINFPSRGPSFQDVLAAVAQADLSERRRQDLASAVRSVARLLGDDPSAIQADPAALARRLAGLAPIAAGISQGRWNNVRSLFRAALGLLRPMLKGRSLIPLSPAWQALSRLLLESERKALSPMMRWMSELGVEPSAVRSANLDGYRDELLSNSLRRHPEKAWRNLVFSWNNAVGRNIGWPRVAIARASRKVVYSLPWSSFPPSLKADTDAWLDRLAGRDLSDDGPARPVRPSTLRQREYELRSFASALVLRSYPTTSLSSLADLVQYKAFLDGLKFYYERGGNVSSTRILGLAGMLKSVARHWVKYNEKELQRFTAIQRRLSLPDQGLTQKNRTRLRAFDDDANVLQLLILPELLRRKADSGQMPARQAAVLASVAVAIELLTVAPIRRQNLASLELHRHLIRVGPKLHLVIPASEVKNRVELEFELPARTADIIRWYTDKYMHRPSIGSNVLFLGREGRSKSASLLGIQISDTVFKYTGLKLNPHLFRHIAAKLFLDVQPGGYEVVRRVLAHKSIDTTTHFYAGMEAKAAVRHFDDVILSRRTSIENRQTRRQGGRR